MHEIRRRKWYCSDEARPQPVGKNNEVYNGVEMTCMCGATDCQSCGPAQGYEVVRVRDPVRGWIWINPPEEEGHEDEKEA